MTYRIFFSWQSDVSNGIGRSFIQSCIERAIRALKADADVDLADRNLEIDADTLGIPGTPPILETIFQKIDEASVFIADLTYVAERPGGGRTPNPNVCIEHGYALKALGWRRVLGVMNTYLGAPDQYELPFDIRHTRWPMPFTCAEGDSPEVREEAKAALTKQLTVALKAIFSDHAARSGMDGRLEARTDSPQAAAESALNELAFDANRGGTPEIVTRPRLTLRLAPFVTATNRRLSPQIIGSVLEGFPAPNEAVTEIDCDAKQWWKCARARQRDPGQNRETTWLIRIVRPGYFEFQCNIGKRIDDDPDILVDGLHLESQILGTLKHMAESAIKLNLAGPALIWLTLEGVEDVRLMRGRSIRKCIGHPDITPPASRVADLSKPLAISLHEQLDMLWQASGWPEGSPSFDETG